MFHKKQFILLLLILPFVIAACGGGGQASWAGITQTQEEGIFVSYGRTVSMFNASGERQWTYPGEDERSTDFFAQVAVAGETAFVGDYRGNIHAIDIATGEGEPIYEIESTRLFGLVNFGGSSDRIIGGIAAGENLIYIPDEEGVFAIDIETRERVDDWRLETPRAVWSQPLYLPADAENDRPARLFVTSLDHNLYALNPDDASILWETDLGGAAPARAAYSPTLDVLFVGTFAAEVVAVNAQTGEILDRYETDGWVWDTPALSEDNTLYLGDLEGYLYALSFTDNGFEEIWTRQVADSKLRATPLVTEDLVIVAAEEGVIYGLQRADGDEEWSEDINEDLRSALILVENDGEPVIITATENRGRLLIALRLEGGRQIDDFGDLPYEYED